MEEENKVEEPKIKLSAKEFLRALQEGMANDLEGKAHSFKMGEVSNVSVAESIRISDRIFAYDISIIHCKLGGLLITNTKFKCALSIEMTSIEWKLDFNKVTIGDSFSLGVSDPNFKGSFDKIGAIRIYDSIFERDTVISKVNVKEDVTLLYLNTASFFSITSCILNGKLSISNTKTADEFIVQGSIVNILDISSIPEKMIMKITKVSFTKMICKGITNLGYLQWNRLNPADDAVVIIENSTMGKWDIVSCDFKATKVIIYSSKITDSFYTNTFFPQTLSTPSNIKPRENVHDILRDGYNQLKTIAQKQNDRKLYLHYQAAELSSFYKTLDWWANFRTKFQLGAMRISNNYGTSWGLGFLFVILSNLIFVSAAYYDRDVLRTWEGVGNYFSGYLSSVFSLISVPIYFKGSWEVNWFYFSRLFIAFGIYQTIAAFRKFGKSE